MTGPRSLSGHPLDGERIVRLVYVDEAGIGKPQEEPFLIVGAVIVHADKSLIEVERHLDKIVKRYIPEEHWANFVFHATHLFNWGGKVFTKNSPAWPLSKRLEIANELAAVPKKFRLPLTVGLCERGKFPSTPDARARNLSVAQETIAAHATTFAACAAKVEHWMRRHTNGEVCLLVVEDNDQARRYMREFQQHFQRQENPSFLSGEAKKYFPFRRIKEDPLFQAKRPSSVLQLADFWAYVAKRIAMDPYHRLYRPLYDVMEPQVWELFPPELSS
jgi:hypothetical protein